MMESYSANINSNESAALNSLSRVNQLPGWLIAILCLVVGSFIPLSLAPFNIWPLSFIALLGLFFLIHQTSLKTIFWRTWLFGVGAYGLGTSWIYVSISGYGGASMPLAIFLVAIFVASMSLLFCIPFLIFRRCFNTQGWIYILSFSCAWTFNEWIHTWLLTGFPWLLIGYAQINNFLAGSAPVTGVIGVGFLVALIAALFGFFISQFIHRFKNKFSFSPLTYFPLVLIAIILCTSFAVQKIKWTTQSTNSIKVAIVQPNIDQDEKWAEENLEPTLKLLHEETNKLWDNQLIVWPESAVPLTYNQAIPYLNEINREAADHHVGVITGIIYDDIYQHKYFNSVAAFGDAIGIYHKRRLVPFGEYVPLEHWLRGLIEFFDLPTSIISFGDEEQHHLKMDGLLISPSVCYEVAYPDLVAQSAKNSNLILSVSNLGWFGDSLGRHQFMQMARMRAIETQRFHLYSTNNGPSAIIKPNGKILVETNAFEQTHLTGEINRIEGDTPFMRYGSLPIILLCGLFLIGLTLRLSLYAIKSNE